jgi:hypothetical protein
VRQSVPGTESSIDTFKFTDTQRCRTSMDKLRRTQSLCMVQVLFVPGGVSWLIPGTYIHTRSKGFFFGLFFVRVRRFLYYTYIIVPVPVEYCAWYCKPTPNSEIILNTVMTTRHPGHQRPRLSRMQVCCPVLVPVHRVWQVYGTIRYLERSTCGANNKELWADTDSGRAGARYFYYFKIHEWCSHLL